MRHASSFNFRNSGTARRDRRAASPAVSSFVFRLSSFGPRGAFTLIEMVVSIGILVIVILAVGVIFKSAARAVGVSQASMEMQSSVRSIQRQIESDVSGIDKGAFMAIRCAIFTDSTTLPTKTVRRCDQIAFISNGSFANHSGITSTTEAFTDNYTVAPAALVWYGQLAMEDAGGSNTNSSADPRYTLDPTATGYKLPYNQVPNSIVDPDTNVLKEDNFNLGRFTMLLVPPASGNNNVNPNGAYVNGSMGITGNPPMAAIDYNLAAISTSDGSYDITQSRVDVAQDTTSQIMSIVRQAIGGSRSSAADPLYEADHFCYRHAALRSPYDGAGGSLVNGYFRMTPIALQGVSTFAVEWTDGSVYVAGGGVGNLDPATGATVNPALVGTTRWFGMNNPDPYGIGYATPANGDGYDAVFSFDNPTKWPVALRFRYHVADPTGRLVGGRDFVEVVKLPR